MKTRRSFINALGPKDRNNPSSWSWVAGCLVDARQVRIATDEYRYIRQVRGKSAHLARLEVVRGLISNEGATPVRPRTPTTGDTEP